MNKGIDMVSEKVTLYRIENNGDLFILRAYLNGSALRLEGQDFSELAKKWYGDEEYEYYFSFDIKNTEKLKKIFNTDDILKAIIIFFNNEMVIDKFEQLCKDNNITYEVIVI